MRKSVKTKRGLCPFNVRDIKLRGIIWGTLPFIGLMVLGIFILCLIPDIAVWLPNHYYKVT
jgi:TRAP-type C4-dicarboxylate transport system permease large subunit